MKTDGRGDSPARQRPSPPTPAGNRAAGTASRQPRQPGRQQGRKGRITHGCKAGDNTENVDFRYWQCVNNVRRYVHNGGLPHLATSATGVHKLLHILVAARGTKPVYTTIHLRRFRSQAQVLRRRDAADGVLPGSPARAPPMAAVMWSYPRATSMARVPRTKYGIWWQSCFCRSMVVSM